MFLYIQPAGLRCLDIGPGWLRAELFVVWCGKVYCIIRQVYWPTPSVMIDVLIQYSVMNGLHPPCVFVCVCNIQMKLIKTGWQSSSFFKQFSFILFAIMTFSLLLSIDRYRFQTLILLSFFFLISRSFLQRFLKSFCHNLHHTPSWCSMLCVCWSAPSAKAK